MKSVLFLCLFIFAGCAGKQEEESTTSVRSDTAIKDNLLSIISVSALIEGSQRNELMLRSNTPAHGDIEIEVDIYQNTRDGEILSETKHAVIAQGTTDKLIAINVADDSIHESNKYIRTTLRIINPNSAKLNADEVAFNVIDDDPVPTINFNQPFQRVDESSGQISVRVLMASQTNEDVTISYDIEGTANNGDDFVFENEGTLTIEKYSNEGNIKLSILKDNVVEGGETIVIRNVTAKNASVGDGAEHVIAISGSSLLNDTGVTSKTFSLSHDGLQDAELGRDALADDDSDGVKGFSFTKIDGNGNELPNGATSWTCVRDNITGILFEVKRPPVDLHLLDALGVTEAPEYRAVNYGYTWYNRSGKNTGGSIGSSNDPLHKDKLWDMDGYCGYREETFRRHALFCNSEAYLQDMNMFGVCGSKTWRLPDIEELRSILNFESIYKGEGVNDTNFLRYQLYGKWMSSTPSAEYPASYWCSNNGQIELCHKGLLAGIIGVSDE